MRKKEYIHIHALLAETTRFLIEKEDMPAERLSAYDALGTSPSTIHKSKETHHEAITVLKNAIEPWVEEPCTDTTEPSTNRPQ